MSRRKSVVVAAVVSLAAGVSPLLTSADAAATVLPKAGCFDIKDSPGDGNVDGQPRIPNDPDLDILGVAVQSTATDLRAFIKVNKLADGPSSSTDGHRYTVTFTYRNTIFNVAGSSYNHGTGALRDALASQGKAGHVVQLSIGVNTVTFTSPQDDQNFLTGDRGYRASQASFTWDKAHSTVIVDLPVKDILKYAGGRTFTGRLTDLNAYSATDEYTISSQADTTDSIGWTVGTNKCFPKPKRR